MKSDAEWTLTAHLTWDAPDPHRIVSIVVEGVEFVPKYDPSTRPDPRHDGFEIVTITTDDALAFFDQQDGFFLLTREMVFCGKQLADEVRRLRERVFRAS